MASELTPVAITMSSAAFDTFLVLYGPDGTLLATNDDSGGSTNSRIPAESGFFDLPQTGQYIIEATPLAPGLTGAYTVNLSVQRRLRGLRLRDQRWHQQAFPASRLSFSRVSGNGPLPGPTTTDSDGFWTRAGFAFGTTYRVRATRSGFTFSPPFQDFAGDLGDLSFITSGTGCVARPSRSDAADAEPRRQRLSHQPASIPSSTLTPSPPPRAPGCRSRDTSPNFIPVLDSACARRRADRRFPAGAPIPPGGGFLELPLTGTYLFRAAARHLEPSRPAPTRSALTSGVPGLISPLARASRSPTSPPRASGPRSASARPTAAASARDAPAWPARRPSRSIR